MNKAYNKPADINPHLLEIIPSVFPTLGIMCTAIGIAYGLSDFNPNDIQGSLPELLTGLKSAFYATIAGIFGLIVFQKVLAIVNHHTEQSPNRPRQASDELTALNTIIERLNTVERIVGSQIGDTIIKINDNVRVQDIRLDEIIKSITLQTNRAREYQQANVNFNERLLANGDKILTSSERIADLQETHSKNQKQGFDAIVKKMGAGNDLLTDKFDEFSVLLSRNNTEALVEVMRASTSQFNAQMSDLINKLVKENFKELNTSVQMLNTWQRENKEQVAELTNQVRIIVEQVNNATADLEQASETLSEVAELSQELVDEDGKLHKLVQELDRVMISDSKFTQIVNKVDRSVDTMAKTTEAFEGTTHKLNDWVRNQMNFNDKAEVIVHQLEEFRNLNGAVWDKYRAEMDKSVKIIASTSTTLSNDLENINQEFYERLNDTLENLDTLIQRFMNGQATTRRVS